jgi:hypothetical protein
MDELFVGRALEIYHFKSSIAQGCFGWFC